MKDERRRKGKSGEGEGEQKAKVIDNVFLCNITVQKVMLGRYYMLPNTICLAKSMHIYFYIA